MDMVSVYLSYKEHLDAVVAARAEIIARRRIRDTPALSEQWHTLDSQIGVMRRVLVEAARMRFEELFVEVAHKKIGASAFRSIIEEVRQLQRHEGTDGTSVMKKRNFRTTVEQMASKLDKQTGVERDKVYGIGDWGYEEHLARQREGAARRARLPALENFLLLYLETYASTDHQPTTREEADVIRKAQELERGRPK